MQWLMNLGLAIYNWFAGFFAPADARGVCEKINGVNGAVVLPTAAQIAAWPATRGGIFINNTAFVALNPANVLAATQQLHQQLTADGWTWVGSGAGNTTHAGCQLLQSDVDIGECGYVANALNVLLTSQNPYGLNQAHINFAVDVYSGAHQVAGHSQGFIADSPLTFNLEGNIFRPAAVNPGAGVAYNIALNDCYLWANHKTVLYNGVYYDPCYDATYNNQGDMAEAEMLRDVNNFNAASFPTVFVLGASITDDQAPNANRGFYLQAMYNGHQLAPDFAAVNAGGYWTVFIGPFRYVDDVAQDYGFDDTVDYLANFHIP